MRNIQFVYYAKGFAILTISFMHFIETIHPVGMFRNLNELGGTGVHLFILLSGFLVSLSHFTTVKSFYQRRFISIVIPYYFYIILIFSINLFCPIYPNDGLYAFMGHIFFFRAFDETIFGSFGFPLWFVGMILQMYLFYPILAKIRDKYGAAKLVIICLSISILWWLLISISGLHEKYLFKTFFLQYLWEFSIGIALASIYKANGFAFWNIPKRISLIFSMFFLFTLGYITIFTDNEIIRNFNDIPALFGYSLFTIFVFSLTSKYRFFIQPFVYMGKVSYFYYLFHIGVLASFVYIYKINCWKISLFTVGLMFVFSFMLAIIFQNLWEHLIFRKIKR